MFAPFLCFILTLQIAQVISSANLLFLNAVASPSHHIWNRVLMEGLARKGYNLTIVSVDIDKITLPNMHYIHMEKVYDALYNGSEQIDLLEMSKENSFEAINSMHNFGYISCLGILNSNGLDVILNYPDDFKFDAVIYDFTCGPCLLPLVHKFKYPPLIAVSAFNNPPYTVNLIGGQKYPAYIPFYSVGYQSNMNFLQRLYNTFLYQTDSFVHKFISYPKMEKAVRKRLSSIDFPSLSDLEKKTVIMLLNCDYALDYPEPLQPNMIQVGGLQITETKPLPEDMKSFINNGKKGSVLMSLGTNIKSNMLDKVILISILNTFEQLPQYNFLWKFESNQLPIAQPKNVKIAKFLTQNDILAESNIKAFITHSGLLSTQESLWYGKPMVGIPFFSDQYLNMEKSLKLGVAVRVHYHSLTVETFKKAILDVLEIPRFTENAQVVSKLFRDKPEKPLDRALWYIEYVLRHPEPNHLQSPTVKLGSFKSNLYDILLFVFGVLFMLGFVAYKIVNTILLKLKFDSTKKRN
ncbi:unnamed protein product [Diamesa hyperborea]